MADFYAARAGTNAGAPLDGFLTAVHSLYRDYFQAPVVFGSDADQTVTSPWNILPIGSSL